MELFQAGYGKEQELEADRDGTDLAVRAGYSPQGAIRLFQALRRIEKEYEIKAQSPDQEISRVAIEGLKGYFRTHPWAEEREVQIRRVTKAQNWPQPPLRPLHVTPGPVKAAVAQP